MSNAIRILAIEASPEELEYDSNFFANFLPENIRNILSSKEEYFCEGNSGGFYSDWYWKAIKIHIDQPIEPGVWIIYPKADMDRADIDKWVRDFISGKIIGEPIPLFLISELRAGIMGLSFLCQISDSDFDSWVND
jgi:hypothetical protein